MTEQSFYLHIARGTVNQAVNLAIILCVPRDVYEQWLMTHWIESFEGF